VGIETETKHPLSIHCKTKVVDLITWWLLQLHHVGHVGGNTNTYNVEEIAYAYYIK